MNIEHADFSRSDHRQAIIDLMNDYMSDTMGGGLPAYTPELEKAVLEGLERHPSKLILLVREGDQFVGLSNCFINFGTFAGKPFINIHDIVILNSFRGKGIGHLLMEEITRQARLLDCAKITLEVREDNVYAQKLYKRMGYEECHPPMHFWTKYL
ncbi:MAG: GNAT family N-acetyltransferase [Bacteroidales bacterium]|nr:GNAT family N-acetyltransferase [Bacteroidales bacterium]